MAEPIEDQGGEILKFMGDGLLAIFAAATTRPLRPLGCHTLRDAAPETALFTAEWSRVRGPT